MLSQIFGAKGILSKKLPYFEWRPSQLIMAEKVREALVEGKKVIIEAGTGTGKTLAYVIPAILSGKKVVISTGTKSLQNQLFYKDIPLVEKILNEKPKVVYLKGRRNYLCLWRFNQLISQKLPISKSKEIKILNQWLKITKTGDIAETPFSPEWSGWFELTASTEQCLGQKCPFWHECFITKMKISAQRAQLIIVNHYLFMADLAIREKGYGQVIPFYEAVIFDEAHQLEEIVSEYFGFQVSNFRIAELIYDINLLFEDKDIKKRLNILKEKSDKFFKTFGHLKGKESLNQVMSLLIINKGIYVLKNLLDELMDIIHKVNTFLDIKENLKERVDKIKKELNFIFAQSDPNYAYWVERRKRSIVFGCSPLKVDLILKEHLYSSIKSIVFTSATLNTGDNFSFFKERLGLSYYTEGLILPSPFDYKNQALLYLPPSMPDPNSVDFLQAAAKEIIKILKITKGRALVLFTNLQTMKEIYDKVVSKIPFNVIIQGEQSSPKLLEIFKSDIHSVLFATATFWEGIDIPGEALSCVIIDRLPFAVPDDPLIKARIEFIRKMGKNPFWSYQVPQAIISLKQGLGRLIRHRQDKGLLAVLDPRLYTRSYGSYFLKNLPPCRITRDLKDVAKFFESI